MATKQRGVVRRATTWASGSITTVTFGNSIIGYLIWVGVFALAAKVLPLINQTMANATTAILSPGSGQ